MNHKYTIAQSPTITSKPEKIINIRQYPVDNVFNSSINESRYSPYNLTSQQPPNKNITDSINTNKPHPLARYLSGYYDPSFESTENDRLAFRGSVSKAIIASEKDKFKYPLLDFSDDETDNKIEDNENKYMPITSELENLFSQPKQEIHKISHQPYETISSSQISIYPEIYPYISKSSPTEGWSSNEKNRLPAGSTFTSINSGITSAQEAFNLSFENNTPTIHLNVDETKEFEKIISPMNDKQRKTIHIDVGKSKKETFENPIEKEADYMYLEALKIRALAVCKFLNDNVSYRKWSSNWKLLEKNLKRNGFLFERLDDTDADIAYVINKGDKVRFRIRDEKRYVPLNIYQYVLYHEMAHMSTTELQHTPKFHELLNIISLAGFELGFIDLSRTTKEFYMTNNQPILCRASLKEEIMDGCNWLRKANPHSDLYYNSIKNVVKKF